MRLELELEANHRSIRGESTDISLFCFSAGNNAFSKSHLGLWETRLSSRQLVDAIRAQSLLTGGTDDNFAINRTFRFAKRWNG